MADLPSIVAEAISVSPHDRLTADLPAARPLVAFLALTDDRGSRISSEHVEVPAVR